VQEDRQEFINKLWLVTGSASGLGPNVAKAVLESGDRLVATARDTKRLDDLVKKYGDRVRAVAVDVTDESAAQAAVQTAVGQERGAGVRGEQLEGLSVEFHGRKRRPRKPRVPVRIIESVGPLAPLAKTINANHAANCACVRPNFSRCRSPQPAMLCSLLVPRVMGVYSSENSATSKNPHHLSASL
jgi:NAD(P)-dependent dehydrogenase (short-subunit alcohol dehydrogenase family)